MSLTTPGRLAAFIRLGRPKFLFQSMMVVGLGVTAAQHEGHPFNLGWYLGTLLFGWSAHLMTHYCNEYFDLDADRANRTPTSWTGGSRILVDGLLPPGVSLGAAFVLLFLAATTAATMPDTASRLMAITILAAAWFYTAPPARLNYHALGEIACAAVLYGLGPLLAHRLQGGDPTAATLTYVALVFVLQFLRMSVMNLADIEGDRSTGKHTLAVALGPRGLIRLYLAGQTLTYTATAVLLLTGTLPALPALAFLATLPIPVWVGRRLTQQALAGPGTNNAVTFWASMHMPITAAALTLALLTDRLTGDTHPDTPWPIICAATLIAFAAWFTRALRTPPPALPEQETQTP
ncbi:prenyltransferase [Streptomyces harbinensis]|uniref:prenyltransferase n=1 Tax=Streptomyces harbinensis TaxID=1176198 RepID=UPI0034DED1E4